MNEGLRELRPGLGLHYKVWDPWGQQWASNAKPSFSEAGLPTDLGPAWLPSRPELPALWAGAWEHPS